MKQAIFESLTTLISSLFFAKASLLSAQANTKGSPWWTFNVMSGNFANGSLTVEVARRVITRRSDEKYWSEGSARYYAETISYTIQYLDKFRNAGALPANSASLRLVLQNDPAVGHWQIFNDPARGTSWSNNDGAAVTAALTQAGADDMASLKDKIWAGRNAAFDQIEKSIADQGVLARVPNHQGLVYSRTNALLYFHPDFVYNIGTITLANLKTYCSGLHLENAEWHLAHFGDIATVLGKPNFFAQSGLIDTPDRRLWGDFTSANAPGFLVPTDTPASGGYGLNLSAYEYDVNGSQFVSQFQQRVMNLNGTDLDTAPLTDGYGGQYKLKIICTASAPSPPSELSKPSTPTPERTAGITLDAGIVWKVPDGWSTPSNVNDLVQAMQQHSALPQAVKFAKELSADNGNIPSWAEVFQPFGNLALVTYGCSSCRELSEYAIVNGAHQIVFVDDNKIASGPQWREYDEWVNQYHLWLRGFPTFKRTERLPSGGERFVFGDDLTNCMACQASSQVEFSYDFDTQGGLASALLTKMCYKQQGATGIVDHCSVRPN